MDVEEENTNSSSTRKRKSRNQIKLTTNQSRRKQNWKSGTISRRPTRSRPSTSSTSQSKEHKKASKEGSKSVPIKEKLELSRNIFKLSGKELGHLVYIVQSNERLSDDGAEEIEIDIDALKLSTLRELQNYVASCLRKQTCHSKRSRVIL